MKRIVSIIFTMIMALALAIGGSVLLVGCSSSNSSLSQEENVDNVETNATIPVRGFTKFNANGGTIALKRSWQISSISVTNFDYGFSVNSKGWFESQNKGVNNSYSMMKISFHAQSDASFTIRYISYAESNYDYALFSNLDQTLSENNSVDGTYYKSTKGESSADEKSITYSNISTGNHFIYVKFRKDSSTHSYNDSLQLFFESDCETGGNKFQFQGMMMGTLPYATRGAYTFDGWWTSADGGELITPYSLHNNGQTVYARWVGAAVEATPVYFDENYSGSNVNLFNAYMMVSESNGNLTEQDGKWVVTSMSGNTRYGHFKIHRLQNNDWSGDLQAASFNSYGRVNTWIEKTEADCKIRMGFDSDYMDATLMIDISSLQNGTYNISVNVYKYSTTTGGSFGEIKIEKGTVHSGYSSEYRLTYTGSTYAGTSSTDLPTPTRTGYTFNGWYRKKNYLDMDAMMGWFNSFDPSEKVQKHWGRIYSWCGSTAYLGNSGSGDTYRLYNPGGFVVGATYRVSYTARNPREDLAQTTALEPFKTNGINAIEKTGDYHYVRVGNWQKISYTFVVPSDFGGFSFPWWHGDRTVFKDIWVERVDINDFETKVTTSTIQPFIAGHTLYASWSANTYTVTFNGNGATSGSMANLTWSYDNWYTISNSFLKTGYSFAGWSVSGCFSPDCSYGTSTTSYTSHASTSGFTHNITGTGYYKNLRTDSGTVTFTAQWKAKDYTVTFNANGGSVSTSSKTVTYNSAYGTLPTATRTYYEQNGWWTAASGGTRVYATDTYSIAGNQTLYAQWTPTIRRHNVYLRVISPDGKTVSDSNDGGSVFLEWYLAEMDAQGNSIFTQEEIFTSDVFNAHQGQDLRMTARPKKGYAFVGFSTSPTPSDAIKNPSSAPEVTATYNPTENTNYYVYFKKLSENQLKYDETDKYFYFEDGYYPQSEAKIELEKMNFSVNSGNAVCKNGILTINGAGGTGSNGSVPFSWSRSFREGEQFVLEYKLLSGSISGDGCFVLEVYNNSFSQTSVRNVLDLGNPIKSKEEGVLTINSSGASDGTKLAFWIYNRTNLTFNNAVFEIKVSYLLNKDLNSSATPTGEVLNFNLGKSQVWGSNGDNYYLIDKSKGYTDKLTVNLWAYKDNWNTTALETPISWTNDGGWNFKLNSAQDGGIGIGYIAAELDQSGYGYRLVKMAKLSELSGGWHMFTLTFDGRYAKGYCDGVLYSTVDYGNLTVRPECFGDRDIVVGQECGWGSVAPDGDGFNGKIKAVTIEREAFDENKIQSIYSGISSAPICEMKIPVYSYNSDRFVKMSNNGRSAWFKFEPIRWRISDYGVDKTDSNIARYQTLLQFKNYASYSSYFVAVSDLILGVGAMHDTRSVREGDLVADMTGFQNIQNMANDLTSDTLKANYYKTEDSIYVDNYSSYGNKQTNAVNKNNSITYSSPFRICSLAELNEVGFVNRQARASDMVAFILGLDKDQVSYWTRDLSNLGAGVAITPTGTQIRPWLDEVLGMRFSYTFKEGSNASFFS